MRQRSIDPSKLVILDLRGLVSTRLRIRGSGYVVSEAERRRYGDSHYLLVPEPRNPVDPLAVAVHAASGRQVGYLSASRAAKVQPFFADLGAGAFRVSGTAPTPTSLVMWVDVPTVLALRTLAKARATEVPMEARRAFPPDA